MWVKNSAYLLITDDFKTEEASLQYASSVHLVGQVGLEPTQELPAHLQCAAIAARRLTHMAGAAGFEPTNNGVRVRCLTTWLRPNIDGGGQGDLNTHLSVLETVALPIELYPRMVMPAGLEPALPA